MPASPELVERVKELVGRRNRELAGDAALKASLGLVFTILTYGLLYWLAWFVGFFLAGSLGLDPWQFAVVVTGVFLIVAAFLSILLPLQLRQVLGSASLAVQESNRQTTSLGIKYESH